MNWSPPMISIIPLQRMKGSRYPAVHPDRQKVADEDRMRYAGGQYYCKSEEEMQALFPYAREALENTHKIAERCNVEIEFGVTKLPKYEVPEGFDSWTYLNHLCREGL